MSRNNVIIVLRYKGRYYVLPNLNADMAWERDFLSEILQSGHGHNNDHNSQNSVNSQLKSTRNRGRALIIAHDYQKKLDTEYGVHETTIV